MTDLFKATHCDRCEDKLKGSRKMSWFTEETICMSCAKNEDVLKSVLPENGSTHEGCGFVPEFPKIQVGDFVKVGQPEDTVGAYHNQTGKVKKMIISRPCYYEDNEYEDEDGNPCYTRDPVYTGPAYWKFIVYFEDKSLDLDFLPFKEEDLTVLERSCNA